MVLARICALGMRVYTDVRATGMCPSSESYIKFHYYIAGLVCGFRHPYECILRLLFSMPSGPVTNGKSRRIKSPTGVMERINRHLPLPPTLKAVTIFQ